MVPRVGAPTLVFVCDQHGKFGLGPPQLAQARVVEKIEIRMSQLESSEPIDKCALKTFMCAWRESNPAMNA